MVRSLDELNQLIRQRENTLAKRLAWEPSDTRERLVRKVQNKLTKNYAQRDFLTGQPQPFDEFNVRLEVVETDNGKRGNIWVDIYDSPLDSTFTGGDPLIANSSFLNGSGTNAAGRKWKKQARTFVRAMANGDYWNGDTEQTLLVAGSKSLAHVLETFDTGNVSLFIDPQVGDFKERRENAVEIHEQDFYELC